jgi:hypothetical protein
MKKTILFLAIASASFVSCNSIYKSQQTPDDLYYSPGQEVSSAQQRRDERAEENYQQYVSTMDDNYLRMRVANNARWSSLDNFAYWNDMRYGFSPIGFNHFNSGWGFNNPWGVGYNPWNIGWSQGWGVGLGFNAWNTWCPNPYAPGVWGSPGFNNPFYSVIGYVNPKLISRGTNSGSNLSAFRNRTYNNNNNYSGGKDSWLAPGTQSGSNNNFGNLVRRVFSSGNTNGNYPSSYDRSARTFSSSSNGSISTSSSAGGSSGGFRSSGSSAGGGRGGRQ